MGRFRSFPRGKQTSFWSAACVMAAISLCSRPAEACSPPIAHCEGSVSLLGVLTDRPTNGCVLIRNTVVAGGGGGWGSPDAGMPDAGAPRGEFAFVGPDGTRVMLVPGALWCPEAELLPNTEYTLVGPASVGGCLYGAEFEYGRFTTGAGPDVTPPPAPAAPSVSCFSQTCESSACCGPYDATVYVASWGGVEDDSGVVLYTGGRSLRTSPSYRWYTLRSGAVMFEQDERFGIGSGVAPLSVGAVDIANNQSDGTPRTGTCTPTPPEDAGAATLSDAGMFDAGRVAPASSSGCSASANNTSLLSALALAVAAVVHRKRRAV